MASTTRAPERGLIDTLPATLAGLWTAITMTQHVVGQFADECDPAAPGGLDAVAEACAEAAASLAISRSEALPPIADLPQPRAVQLCEALPLATGLTNGCIDLAIDLLGNEEEPLSAVEVLAVTRAVTALCAARSLAQGCAA